MSSPYKSHIAKLSLILLSIPVLAHGYETGPPWGFTAAPGDNPTACANSGCHSGKPNTGPGNVTIILPNGNSGTYVPGQSMQLLIQITDSTKRAFGFEMTARLSSSPATAQAGDFAPADANTQVLCSDDNIESASGCAPQVSVEDIEHNFTGYTASISSNGSFTYMVNWTPPASASAGNVTLYVAANCGIGNPPVVAPTDIYTSNLTLTPAAAPDPNAPAITSVLNAATLSASQITLAPNTYAAIFGQNLSTTNPGRTWATADFTANSNGTLGLPVSLDGTSVTVGGTPAYVNFISPGQLNIITPPTVAAGSNVPVVVAVNGQASAAFNVTMQSLAPSFFTWQPNTSDSGKYLIAQHSDFSNIGKVALFPGTAANFTTPAEPGETIILYATGFGPTTPPIASGIETDQVYPLSPAPGATFGGQPATVVFGGLIPPLSQIYQFNVTVPSGAPNGDSPLVVTVGGTPSFSGLITVQAP